MQTPPCPACGTPLRWFPEMNAWGCDRCQQMMPAAPPSGYGPMPGHAPGRGGGFSHMPQTQAEKMRTFILLGILIVAVVGVIIMLASDNKKKGDEGDDGEAPGVEATGEPAETAPPPALQQPPQQAQQPQQPPASGQTTTPNGAPITIPECAEVATLRKQIDACAAISADIKKTLDGMADNKMGVFDNGAPSGDYADMVRGKCAGTVDTFKQSLDQAGCK